MKNGFIENSDVQLCLKDRPKDCNKGDFGYVALVGGCTRYSGAIRLAAMANCAMRAGAGVAAVVVPENLCPLISEHTLVCTLYPMPQKDGMMIFSDKALDELCRRYRVIAIGMGIGLSEEVEKIVTYLLMHYTGTLLVDADGLTALSKISISLINDTKAKLVLTPHVGEFARLYGCEITEVLTDPENKTSELAQKLSCIVLLKGPTTVVTDGHEILRVDRGCPGMATAGSGDVLSGIMSALLSCNQENLLLAAASGAYINGVAGELAEKEHGSISMIACDTAGKVEEAIKYIQSCE